MSSREVRRAGSRGRSGSCFAIRACCPGRCRAPAISASGRCRRVSKKRSAARSAAGPSPPSQRKADKSSATVARRYLTVTQGNVNNNHLYLTEAMDLLPPDVLGGPGKESAARTVRVEWGGETVETDVVRARNIFRRRGWIGRFFAANDIAAGDRVVIEQIEPYVFRVSKAGR